jgi:peptide/nickel transport system substrate-binding protein
MSEEKKEEKIDRRKYIKYVGAGAVVAAAAAAIGYGISELTKPPPTPTTVVTTVPAPTTIVTTAVKPTTVVTTVPTTVVTTVPTTEIVTTTPKVPQILKIGWRTDIESLDPWKAMGRNGIVYTMIQEPLLSLDVDYTKTPPVQLHPCLAESVEVREEGKIWRIHLRRGVKFHCGESLTANAVKFTIDRYMNPEKPGVSIGEVKMVKYPLPEPIDDYTIDIELNYPYTIFDQRLSWFSFGITCPKCVKEYGDLYGIKAVCGTGPFKFNESKGWGEWKVNDYLKIVKNEEYWGGPKELNWGKPPILDALIWRVIPEDSTRLSAYNAGEIDFIWDVPSQAIDSLERDPNTNLLKIASNRTTYWTFRCDKPPTNDVKFRYALAYAIDRESIAKNILGALGTKAVSFIAPGVVGFKEISLPEYNPDKAKSLLAELGWKPGPDGTLRKDGQVLKLKLIGWGGRDPKNKEVTEATAAMLRDIGIDASAEVPEMAQYAAIARDPKSDHDMAQWGWGPIQHIAYFTDNYAHSRNVPPAGYNVAWYSNPEFDKIDEEAVGKTGEEAYALYWQCLDILAKDLPFLPMCHINIIRALKKYVKGFVLHPSDWWSYHFLKVYIEK